MQYRFHFILSFAAHNFIFMFRMNQLEVKLPTTRFTFIFNVQYNLLQIISGGSTDIRDLQQIKLLARALEHLRLQPIMR
jgi:hypothetical protein